MTPIHLNGNGMGCVLVLMVVVGHITASKMNVLFLVADDLRPELSFFNNEQTNMAITPNLDKLAADALVFQSHYVQQAVCGPTRASFMTGRRPNSLDTITHTTPTYWRARTGNFTSLPQTFKENGYHTVSYGKVFDLRTSSFNQTTDFICDGLYSWSEPPVYCGTVLWKSDAAITKKRSQAVFTSEQEDGISDAVIASAAISKLNGTNGSLPYPYFMAVGLHRPHLPFLVPQRTLDLYPPEDVVLPYRLAPENMPLAASECAGGKVCQPNHSSMELWEQYNYNGTGWNGWNGAIGDPLPVDTATTLRRYYLAAISWVDIQFGRVLSALEERGDMSNTVITLVGDHGWHVGENGMWAKCTNFEIATRAPFLIKVPGLTNGGIRTRSLTEHVDILPTVVAAAMQITVPTCDPIETQLSCTDGINLLPLATNNNTIIKKAAYSQWPHPFDSQTPKSMGYTMRTPAMRYTEWVLMTYDANGTFHEDWSTRCARELYDLSADPSQKKNIAESNSSDVQAIIAELSKQLHAGWRVAAGSSPWPANLPQVNQTAIPSCPLTNGPAPPPGPPAPITPPSPCTQLVTPKSARTCSDPSAQKNPLDESCWCRPATKKVASMAACQTLCLQDPKCISWTFATRSGNCLRHSTNMTFVHESENASSGCKTTSAR